MLDTSALMSIVRDEPEAASCQALISEADRIMMSAGTLAEALIVADRNALGHAMRALIAGIGCEIVPVAEGDAIAVAQAYSRWGKGLHPAGLNLGDCFAYALAHRLGCALVFKGEDFGRTDVRVARLG